MRPASPKLGAWVSSEGGDAGWQALGVGPQRKPNMTGRGTPKLVAGIPVAGNRITMQTVLLGMCLLLAAGSPDIQAQRGRGAKTATLAIVVTSPDGAQISNVSVTVEGPANRKARTEGGRIAFENLPPGAYRLRFEREGFITLERELTARAGAPVDVKVTLSSAPEPPAPPKPVEPVKPPVDAKPISQDVLAVIDKEFVGRAKGRTTPLACGSEGNASLIQLNAPIPQHSHDDADEFIYVVAGEGSADVQGSVQRLRAGVLLFLPRGVPHALSQSGRNPLVLISTRAGGGCGGGLSPF
jgi:mannose-6-phosphate isomerase-like protein (cupin superfamily)